MKYSQCLSTELGINQTVCKRSENKPKPDKQHHIDGETQLQTPCLLPPWVTEGTADVLCSGSLYISEGSCFRSCKKSFCIIFRSSIWVQLPSLFLSALPHFCLFPSLKKQTKKMGLYIAILLFICWFLKEFDSSSRAKNPECKVCGPRCAAKEHRAVLWAPGLPPDRLLYSVPIGCRADTLREYKSGSVCPMMSCKRKNTEETQNMHAGVVQTANSLPTISHWWKGFPTGEAFEKWLLPARALCSVETNQL